MKEVETKSLNNENVDLNKDYMDDFWSTYRQHVHTLLAWGYADALEEIRSTEDEPEISGYIAEAIDDRFNSLDCPPWCDQISIRDDHPTPGKGRAGRKRLRPDIVFQSTGKKPRQLYHFEAKRLCGTKSANLYLGGGGLQRFLDGRYAGDNDEAGMIGYIQSDDIITWTKKLKATIDGDFRKKNKILLFSSPCDIRIIESFPLEWMSEHHRLSGKNITIYHVLLDCRPGASIGPEIATDPSTNKKKRSKKSSHL